jgi:prevent-host-death family protein
MKASRNTARQNTPEPSPRSSFTATEAKNEFGRLLEWAILGNAVVITRHDTPKAVLISMDEYNALKNAPALQLEVLSKEFDAMHQRMQTPRARAAVKALFNSTPGKLGRAAVVAARKRG